MLLAYFLQNERILYIRQNGCVSVMIWRAFCKFGVSGLAFGKSNQNAQKYNQTLEKFYYLFQLLLTVKFSCFNKITRHFIQ